MVKVRAIVSIPSGKVMFTRNLKSFKMELKCSRYSVTLSIKSIHENRVCHKSRISLLPG